MTKDEVLEAIWGDNYKLLPHAIDVAKIKEAMDNWAIYHAELAFEAGESNCMAINFGYKMGTRQTKEEYINKTFQ